MSRKPENIKPDDPQPVLERQRAEHDDSPGSGADDVDDTGVGKLVNNTGQDGDAPTG